MSFQSSDTRSGMSNAVHYTSNDEQSFLPVNDNAFLATEVENFNNPGFNFNPMQVVNSIPSYHNNEASNIAASSTSNYGGLSTTNQDVGACDLKNTVVSCPPNESKTAPIQHPLSVNTSTPNRMAHVSKTPYSGQRKHIMKPSHSTAQERTKLLNKRTAKYQNSASASSSHPPEQQSSAPAGNAIQTDPFTHWYQMMSQYYSQLFPGYQIPNAQEISGNNRTPSKPLANTNRTSMPRGFNSVLPQKPSIPSQRQVTQIAPTGPTFSPTNALDYASYYQYYQYYYGPAAAQLWAASLPFPAFEHMGRKTPKHFHAPHIRAWLSIPGILLQILPNRPADGELPLVEMIDLSELAHQAVAEATKRATEVGLSSETNRFQELSLNRDGFSSGTSDLESPDHLSSFQAGGGGDEDGDEARAYDAIATAWDRTEHTLYPGPLDPASTLKPDVLVFLREKLAEIQDRLPIDWESAALLITFLEWMVKNNGTIQPSDLVNLLLEGHEPHTEKFRAPDFVACGGSGSIVPTRPLVPHDSFASLPTSEPPSGRQSPYDGLISSEKARPSQTTKAASECGAYVGPEALRMRASQAAGRLTSAYQTTEFEDKILDRFRELLMHGLTMKALEHACRAQLWGHAFALAQHIGPTVFDKVMEKFLTRAVPPTDPILTFYQISAGEVPQAVTNVAYGRGSDIGEWRPHLAMILATESTHPDLVQSALERLGDGLISRRLVYAAHLCYLLMGPLCEQPRRTHSQPVYHLPEKIWLLGVPRTSPSDGFQSPIGASTEAIQLTEVYEYAMRLANRNYRLPQLLPFKLVYATRLIDSGLLNKANRYLTSIGLELLLEAESQDMFNCDEVPPVYYSLIENCLRLAEPLQSHPELDELGATPVHRGAANRGTSQMRAERGAGWIDRLRGLYHELNKKLNRPTYQSVNMDVRSSDCPPAFHPKAEPPSPPPPPAEPVHPPPTATSQLPHPSNQQSGVQQPPATMRSTQPTSHNRPQGRFDANSPPHRHSLEPDQKPPHSPTYAHTGHSQHSIPHDDFRCSDIPSHLAQPYSRSSPIRGKQEDTSVANHQPTPYGADFNSPVSGGYGPSPLHHDEAHRLPQTHNPPDRSPTANEADYGYAPQQQQQQQRAQQQRYQNQESNHYPVPNPMDVTSSTGDSMTFPPDQVSAMSQVFFVPPVDQTAPQAYDYFAGSQYRPNELTEGNRSRTVSGGSHSSLVGPYAASTQSSVTPSGTRSRNSGESAYHPLRHSGSIEGHPTRQPISNSATVSDIHRQERIKEEPSNEDTKPKNATDEDSQQSSKDGWLSGWLGKLKRAGPKNVHLPDDKNPSIVWDDRLKQWIDVNNPDAANNATAPPPPPATFSAPSSSADFSGRPSNRSRYVNVLANQTYGSAAARADGPIQPPLPPTMTMMYNPPASEAYQ